MNLLVIGSGGREHALCWKLRQSPQGRAPVVRPGQCRRSPTVAECVTIGDGTRGGGRLRRRARRRPIWSSSGRRHRSSTGLVDALRAAGIKRVRADGGGGAARGVEGFHQGAVRAGQHPDRRPSRGSTAATRHARIVVAHPLPVVVKADGLAAGKGVVIAQHRMTKPKRHSTSFPGPVVIEAFLTGPEASLFVLCDGSDIVPLGSAHRITSASGTAIPGRTPAAWARCRRPRR